MSSTIFKVEIKGLEDVGDLQSRLEQLHQQQLVLQKDLSKYARDVKNGTAGAAKDYSLVSNSLRLVKDEVKDLTKAQIANGTVVTREGPKAVGEYKRLSIQLAIATQKFKDMAAAQGLNSSKVREAGRELKKHRDALYDIDKAAGQYRRNVGNYFGSIVKSSLGIGGIVGAGVLAVNAIIGVLKSATDQIVKFDERVADLSKVTNVPVESARALAKSIASIDTRTSVQGLLDLAVAGGRLGIAAKDIKGFVEEADKLFIGLGDTLEGSAEDIALTVGKIAENFGLIKEYGVAESLNKVASVLNELGATSAAQEPRIIDFVNRMTGIGSVAGFTVAQVAALGATFDEGGQSIEIAATTLQRFLPEIALNADRFAHIIGESRENFDALLEKDAFGVFMRIIEASQSDRGGLAGLAKTLNVTDAEAARAATIFSFLAKNIGRVEANLITANRELTNNTSINQEVAKKQATLAAEIERTKKAWTEYIIKLDSGRGVISSLILGINQLAQSLLKVFSFFENFAESDSLEAIIEQSNLLTGEYSRQIGKLEGLLSAYDKLKAKLGDNTLSTTDTKIAQDALVGTIQKIGSIIPSAVGNMSDLTKSFDINRQAVIDLRDQYKLLSKESAKEIIKVLPDAIERDRKELDRLRKAQASGYLPDKPSYNRDGVLRTVPLKSRAVGYLNEDFFKGQENEKIINTDIAILETALANKISALNEAKDAQIDLTAINTKLKAESEKIKSQADLNNLISDEWRNNLTSFIRSQGVSDQGTTKILADYLEELKNNTPNYNEGLAEEAKNYVDKLNIAKKGIVGLEIAIGGLNQELTRKEILPSTPEANIYQQAVTDAQRRISYLKNLYQRQLREKEGFFQETQKLDRKAFLDETFGKEQDEKFILQAQRKYNNLKIKREIDYLKDTKSLKIKLGEDNRKLEAEIGQKELDLLEDINDQKIALSRETATERVRFEKEQFDILKNVYDRRRVLLDKEILYDEQRVLKSIELDEEELKSEISSLEASLADRIFLGESWVAAKAVLYQKELDLDKLRDRKKIAKYNEGNRLIDQANNEFSIGIDAEIDAATAAKKYTLATQLRASAQEKILQNDISIAQQRLGVTLLFNGMNLNAIEDANNAIRNAEDELNRYRAERVQELHQQILDGAQQIAESITNTIFDSELQSIEKQKSARIKAIDEEFAARIKAVEGNAQLVENLEKQREAAKEAEAKKAFEKEKKLTIARLILLQALAVGKELASGSFFDGLTGFAEKFAKVAIIVGTLGAQIAAVAAQKFALGGRIRRDGKIEGARHSDGGVKANVFGVPIEVEAGERHDIDENGNFNIINRKSSSTFSGVLDKIYGKSFKGKAALLSTINSHNRNGVALGQDGLRVGAVVPGGASSTLLLNQQRIEAAIIKGMSDVAPYLADKIGGSVMSGSTEGSHRGSLSGSLSGIIAGNKQAIREKQLQSRRAA